MRLRLAPPLALAVLSPLPPPPAPPSPSSGRSRARATSWTGDTEGLSVDSEGRVRLAPAARALHDPEAPYVWCAGPGRQGARSTRAPATTGKVFRVEGGQGPRCSSTRRELEVHALAVGTGRPALRRHLARRQGVRDRRARASRRRSSIPRDKYIWALAFDGQGRLLVATGAEGTRLPRGHGQGKAEALLHERGDPHHRAGRRTAPGNVYAGSSPGGILYRIDPRARSSSSTTRPTAR